MKNNYIKHLIILSITLLCSTSISAQCYDANGDGKVTVADVPALVDFLMKGHDDNSYLVNGEIFSIPEYVDLGLPSGTLWAKANIGATAESDCGLYFAWGEIKGYYGSDKHSFIWGNYSHCNGTSSTLTKYCTSSTYGTVDNRKELETVDDAATANWGNDWRMPTRTEVNELVNNTDNSLTVINGVSGYKFANKNDASKFIFLPVTGYYWGVNLNNDSYGYYWTSTLGSTSYPLSAYGLSFTSDGYCSSDGSSRFFGRAIRPIRSTILERTKVSSISIISSTLFLRKGETSTLAVVVLPDDAFDKTYTWSSSNTSVATVDADGKVTAVDNGTATITCTANDGSGVNVSCTIIVDTHEYVDLGLPSGTQWAKTNIGAETETDYGLYFAWGETTGYTSDTSDGRSFNWTNYKWMANGQYSWKGCTKYTFADGQTSGCWYSDGAYVGTTVNGTTYKELKTLEAADDAATANWGCDWCMPTHTQMQELINCTDCSWATVNNVSGYKFAKIDDSSTYIFLPVAGYRVNSDLYSGGAYGRYLSSELYSSYSYSAWVLNFSAGDISADFNSTRSIGQSVRAVRSSIK